MGIVGGTLVAVLASRLLGALVFGIATTDWRVYALVAMAVFGVSLLAAVRPVLRAGEIDPAEVMRTE